MSRLSCRFSSYVIGFALSSSSLSNGNIGANADVLDRRDDFVPPRRADAEPLPRPCVAGLVCVIGVVAYVCWCVVLGV